jgi:hypothetical protein
MGILTIGGCTHSHVVSSPGVKAHEVSLSVEGGQAALAWHGSRGGRDVIALRWLDPEARGRGNEAVVTDGARYAYEPDLLLLDGYPVLAWYEKADDGALTAWLARLGSDGKVAWRRSLSGEGGKARNAIVRRVPEGLAAAWIEAGRPSAPPGVWTQLFTPDGRPITTPRRLLNAGRSTWNLNGAVDASGELLLTYDAPGGAIGQELQLVAVRGEAVRRWQLTPDDGKASLYPDIAISSRGQAAVTWFDERDGNTEIYLGVLPLADLLAGKPLPARRLTRTPASSIGAYLTWNGDRLAVAWCDAQPGQQELFVQFFRPDGTPSSNVRRLTRTVAASSIPSLRASGRGFLLGWSEYVLTRASHDPTTGSAAMAMRLD